MNRPLEVARGRLHQTGEIHREETTEIPVGVPQAPVRGSAQELLAAATSSQPRPANTAMPFRQDFYNQPQSLMVQQGGEEKGTPIRPPASANFFIDSLDRYNKQYAGLQTVDATRFLGNDFKLASQDPLIYGYFTRLGITQVYLKYNVPTVVAGKNDSFNLQQTGSAAVTITIPQGYYNVATLGPVLQAQIQAAGAPYNTYTVSWSTLTNSWQIASNNATTFYMGLSAGVDPNSAIARGRNLIGVSYANMNPGNAAVTQTLAPPRLYYTGWIDIVSERLTKYQRVKDAESGAGNNAGVNQTLSIPPLANIVARVYLTPPGSKVYDISGAAVPTPGSAPFDMVVDYNPPKYIRWSPNEAVFELDFRLYDQFGQPLYWDPSTAPTEFALSLHASET